MREIVIFGGSGDLSKRKLIPALSALGFPDLRIIAYGRSDLEESFHQHLQNFYSYDEEFLSRVKYIKGDYYNLASLQKEIKGNPLFYLAVPPEQYAFIIKQLRGLNPLAIAVEKPFGTSQDSFKEIENAGFKALIFVDHYLLKPLIVACPAILGNLSSIMSSQTVRSIEACFCESIGANGRTYYDNTGCLLDVIQNHLAICVATILGAFEPTKLENLTDIRYEVLKNMHLLELKPILGQYEGYKEEFGLDTVTETFALFGMEIRNGRWAGVPLTMYGGKGLREKSTRIMLYIKKEAYVKFYNLALRENQQEFSIEEIIEMKLCFNIAPSGSVVLHILVESGEIEFTLCSSNSVERAALKTIGHLGSYKALFVLLLAGDYSYCCSTKEVAETWRIFDSRMWRTTRPVLYKRGALLPDEAIEALEKISKM